MIMDFDRKGYLRNRFRQRRNYAAILLSFAVVIWLAYDLGLRLNSLPEICSGIIEYARRYSSPDFTQFRTYLILMWQTIAIAAWGTFLSLIISFISAPLAASNYTPMKSIFRIIRLLQIFFRSMPDMLLALIFVSALGLGSVPGILALALHTSGFLGKFFAEHLEQADMGGYEAMKATGAGYLQRLMFAGWPVILPEAAGYTLYIFDRNVRMATILGLIGAGGIGRILNDSLRLFEYNRASAIIIIIIVTIITIDVASNWLRKRCR